eukprot:CAMPEP_0175359712 /NCGR_PEP_ID=MMETSP0095-20121207/15657_1 /TAXON_ID=311494 /ORGANISM="Alexandrium monilatum, Strain CCMP3105" /LENGTH=47 /DNA_ID= /DNA_START= /DNA_END= /DNA_ORIENTATION=
MRTKSSSTCLANNFVRTEEKHWGQTANSAAPPRAWVGNAETCYHRAA